MRRRTHLIEGRHYAIDPETECWNWLMTKDRKGYGLSTYTKGDGREHRAHRESWRLANGQIPDGLVIDHLCRNPSCINPAHLEPVRQAVNTQRGDKAKVSQAQVAAIRQRIVAGDSLTAIAQDFGVSVHVPYSIAHDKCWRVDPDAPRQPVLLERDCPNCGTRIVGGRRSRKYCDDSCRNRFNGRVAYRRLNRAQADEKGLR